VPRASPTAPQQGLTSRFFLTQSQLEAHNRALQLNDRCAYLLLVPLVLLVLLVLSVLFSLAVPDSCADANSGLRCARRRLNTARRVICMRRLLKSSRRCRCVPIALCAARTAVHCHVSRPQYSGSLAAEADAAPPRRCTARLTRTARPASTTSRRCTSRCDSDRPLLAVLTPLPLYRTAAYMPHPINTYTLGLTLTSLYFEVRL